jgi:Toprim-like
MNRPDVRTFYAALDIELPSWLRLEAPVRCFADPEAHNRGDRNPSCSVNLASGAWNCHGCGARGGAYDAALALGHTPRSAMDLLIAHGLAEPRTIEHSRAAPRVQRSPAILARPERPERPPLSWDDANVQLCAERLDADSRLVRQLILGRAWAPRAMRALELGFDGARITIPVRDEHGKLRGVLRYDPFGRREPKMRAVPGTQLGLVPSPARERAERILLVEGPPDMIAARSCGIAAIAIPGTTAWQPSWAPLLAGRHVTVVMDCDPAGRRAAQDIAASLGPIAAVVELVDLWPDRHDGYDLTDRILERRRSRPGPLTARTIASLLRPASLRHLNTPRACARRSQEASR